MNKKKTGNYYYGARYYDPKISVWLSVDPLAHKYPSLSPYVFTGNNPIMLVDPDGRDIWTYIDGELTLTTETDDDFNIFLDGDGNEIFRTNEVMENIDMDRAKLAGEVLGVIGSQEDIKNKMQARADQTGFDNSVFEGGFEEFKSSAEFFGSGDLNRINGIAELLIDDYSSQAGAGNVPVLDQIEEVGSFYKIITGSTIQNDIVDPMTEGVGNYYRSFINYWSDVYDMVGNGIRDFENGLSKGWRP